MLYYFRDFWPSFCILLEYRGKTMKNMNKRILIIIVMFKSIYLFHTQAGESNINFTAVPPAKTEPQTPMTFLMSPLQDDRLREALFKEQDRFKLLKKELPYKNGTDTLIEYEQIKEYTKRVSRMFIHSVRDMLQEKMMEQLVEESRDVENPFSGIVEFIKKTKRITDRITPNLPDRKIAVSVKPDLETPSVKMANFLFDQTQVTYNILLRSPTFSIEQAVTPLLSSQFHYQPHFQTLDSGLKGKLNDDMNVHMIHRSNFSGSREQSFVFGLSIDID